VSALVQRLEDAGHVVREPHPTDGRSNVVRLSPQLVARASQVFDPLVSDLERLSGELDDAQLRTIETFLTRVVEVRERHADRAYAKQRRTGESHATPVPTLWG
jgi:DNA-binding MarR family transcriptional regulator